MPILESCIALMNFLNISAHHEELMINRNRASRELPVIIITGYLGSGKTTLVQHLLAHQYNLRFCCAINDFNATFSFDTTKVSSSSSLKKINGLSQCTQPMYELENGSVVCGFDLGQNFKQLKDIVRVVLHDSVFQHQPFDYMIIETSGTTNPLDMIAAMNENFGPFHRVRLDSVVTVVNAEEWLSCPNPLDHHHFPLLSAQCHAADTVLVNKIDLLLASERDKDLETVRRHLREVAPHLVHIVPCKFGNVPLPDVLDLERAMDVDERVSHEQRSLEPKWLCGAVQRSRDYRDPMIDSSESIVSFESVCFQSQDPISFVQFEAWIRSNASSASSNKSLMKIHRMKGFLYLQESPAVRYEFQFSGFRRVQLRISGPWRETPVSNVVVIGLAQGFEPEQVLKALARTTDSHPGVPRCKLKLPETPLHTSLRYHTKDLGQYHWIRWGIHLSPVHGKTLELSAEEGKVNVQWMDRINSGGYGVLLLPMPDSGDVLATAFLLTEAPKDLVKMVVDQVELVIQKWKRSQHTSCLCGF